MMRKRQEEITVRWPKPIVALICLLVLLAALLVPLTGRDAAYSERENRQLASPPRLSWQMLASGQWMEQADRWYEDRFPLRGQLLAVHTAALRLEGRQDNGSVYYGDEQLYQYEMLDDGKLMNNVSDLAVFVSETLPLTQPGIRTSLLLVPTAAAVLPERLPDYAPVADESAGIARVSEILTEADPIEISNVLPGLRAAAETGDRLYFAGDHHWTQDGAMVAYQAWAEAAGLDAIAQDRWRARTVSEDFRGTLFARSGLWTMPADVISLREPPADLFDPDSLRFTGSEGPLDMALFEPDKLDTFDQYQVYLGGNHNLFEIHNDETESEERLLLVKDSYANALIPYLFPYFAQITVVDARYLTEDLGSYLEENSFSDCLILYGFYQLAADDYVWKLNQ